jgi:ATP-binding cassette, subfamily B, bacterial
MSSPDELPPGLSSMWRLCRLGLRFEPGLMIVAFGLSVLAALPDALLALWLKFVGDGVLGRDWRLVYLSLMGLAASAVGTWYLRTISTRVQRRFRDKVTIALESHVARLQASVASIAHHERPAYLDRLSVLREQVFVLDHMYMSVFTTAGWVVRLVVTVTLLASIHWSLALLALFALPTVLTNAWRPAVERRVQEAGASWARLARHLFLVGTTASPAKEVRVTGIGELVARRRRQAWEQWALPIASARLRSAWWHSTGWAVFAGGYVGAIVFVSTGIGASPGEVLLVLAAGSRLSAYVSATVGEIGFLRGIWLDGARRLAWLEDYAASFTAKADQPVPARLKDGIVLEGVSFAYPGTTKLVLDNVDVKLPAGAVVAVVGENGAGKSTLVKLLSKFYEPSAGRILVDGADLARMPADQWRERLSGAYQDFFRFELRAQHAVGVGDHPRMDHDPAVLTAVGRAGADDVARRGAQTGRVTVLVSHRFSTVRMADLIVVLDGARVVEVGTHEALMAKGGQYCELYSIQAAAYS